MGKSRQTPRHPADLPSMPERTQKRRSVVGILLSLTLLGVGTSGLWLWHHLQQYSGTKALTPRAFYDVTALQNVRRAPCPGLNTLANHGFLPHDGQNVARETMMEAVSYLGLPPLIAWGIIHYVYRVCHNQLLPTDHALAPLAAIDLDWLGVHNILERDASLTRNDAAVPPYDAKAKQPELIEALLKEAGDDTHLNVTHVVRHRLKRWYTSLETNREFHMGPLKQVRDKTLFDWAWGGGRARRERE